MKPDAGTRWKEGADELGAAQAHVDAHIAKATDLLAQHAIMTPAQAKDICEQVEAILPLGKSLLEANRLITDKWKLA